MLLRSERAVVLPSVFIIIVVKSFMQPERLVGPLYRYGTIHPTSIVLILSISLVLLTPSISSSSYSGD